MTFIALLILFFWVSSISGRVARLEKRKGEVQVPDVLPQVKPLNLETLSRVEPARPPERSVVVEAPIFQKTEESKNEIEYKFGSQIFTVVGALAVLLGAGFFLQFAIQAGLLTESMRIVLGALGGAVLIGVGSYLREKYEDYAHILAGTGIGVWHLSVFASFAFYGFISQEVAYVVAGIITAIGVTLSVGWNARYLAVFASLGGFLAPLLFGWDPVGFPYKMMVYLLILNSSLLAVSYFRSWRELESLTFFATAFWFLNWFVNGYSEQFWTPALVFLALYAFSYQASRVLSTALPETKQGDTDALFPSLNATFFAGISYAILNPLFPDAMGIYMGLLGALYIMFGLIFGLNDERTSFYRHYMVGIGLSFLAIAVPLQFDRYAVTMVWAIKAVVVAFLGFSISSYRLRAVSFVLLLLSFVRLFVLDITQLEALTAFVNDRFITILVVFLSSASIAALFWHNRKQIENELDKNGYVVPTHLSLVLVLTGFGLEIGDFFSWHWIPVLFSVVSFTAGYFSLLYREQSLRFGSLLGYFVAFLYIANSQNFEMMPVLFNVRTGITLLYAGSIGLLAALFRRESTRNPGTHEDSFVAVLVLLLNGLLLRVISLEVLEYFRGSPNLQQVALSVAWLLYAMVLLGIGITKRLAHARQLSILLCAVVVAKVFLFDSLALSSFFRFVSFMTLGLILLLVGYLYNRYRLQITQFIKGE